MKFLGLKMYQKKKSQMKNEDFMRLAIHEARKAGKKGEIPVGAVIVAAGKILARAHNQPIARSDPTAHAEILAIRSACRRLKNYRLSDCELFVTLEPCSMCLGAAVQARIKRIVFAASDPKAGAVHSVMEFPWLKLNHRPLIEGGLLAPEASNLLSQFFKAKRIKGGTEN